MYYRDLKDALFSICFAVVGLTVIFTLALAFQNRQCRAAWHESGFYTDWGPIQGCRISRDMIHWMPASAYRELGTGGT